MRHLLTILCIALVMSACTPDPLEQVVIPVQTVELSSTSLSLHPGDKVSLTATVLPDNATDRDLAWSSSDVAVASVSRTGEVTAVSVGDAVISVSCGGKMAACNVTVSLRYIPVTAVTLDRSDADVLVGESFQLTATVLPDDATEKEVSWTSSNPDVALIDNGLVTALTAGETVITAAAGECTATCRVTITVPFSYGGMCLEAVSGGIISISNPNELTIEYKKEEQDWMSVSDDVISIAARTGERVWFRGLNGTYAVKNADESVKETVIRCYDGDFYLYGNLMSLICGDDYETGTEIAEEYAFCKLFYQNGHIISHPSLDIELPATTLSPSCYRIMFYGCSKLTRAPKLPARILTEACYASMFAYCTSLKEFPEMAATDMAYMSCTWMMMGAGIEEAPELPAMNLARSCYEFMFMECPNLRKGPSDLPATELAANCYTGMFQRSDKLETAPALPATKLKYSCYSHMFNGCASLRKAPELPAMELAEACYQRMFGNSGLEEAPELPAMNLEVMCYQYMFEGARSLTKAPVLPALKLNYWCYEKMFHDCSSLCYVDAAFLTTPSSGYTSGWLEGVASEGTFVKNPNATWDVRGVNGIPEGWFVQ